MGVGLVFEADLRTEEHPSHWVNISKIYSFIGSSRSCVDIERRLLKDKIIKTNKSKNK